MGRTRHGKRSHTSILLRIMISRIEAIEYIKASGCSVEEAEDMVKDLPAEFDTSDPNVTEEICDVMIDGMLKTIEGMEWVNDNENRNTKIHEISRART